MDGEKVREKMPDEREVDKQMLSKYVQSTKDVVNGTESTKDMVDGMEVDEINLQEVSREEVLTQIQRNGSKHLPPEHRMRHKARKLKDVCDPKCCKKQTTAEEHRVDAVDLSNVSELTVEGEPFGASIQTYGQGNNGYRHFFRCDQTTTGIAKTLHIRKGDELLLAEGRAVTYKDHSYVVNLFRDMTSDSERPIILVICRKKGKNEKFVKITFSLIYTDDKVRCKEVNRVPALSHGSPIVAVDLHYIPGDVTGIIKCGGSSQYARNNNGQLTSQELSNPDGSCELYFISGKRTISICETCLAVGIERSKGLLGLHTFTFAYWGRKVGWYIQDEVI